MLVTVACIYTLCQMDRDAAMYAQINFNKAQTNLTSCKYFFR